MKKVLLVFGLLIFFVSYFFADASSVFGWSNSYMAYCQTKRGGRCWCSGDSAESDSGCNAGEYETVTRCGGPGACGECGCTGGSSGPTCTTGMCWTSGIRGTTDNMESWAIPSDWGETYPYSPAIKINSGDPDSARMYCNNITDPGTCNGLLWHRTWNQSDYWCRWYTPSECGPTSMWCVNQYGDPIYCQPKSSVPSACLFTDPTNSCGWRVCKNICGDNATTSTCSGYVNCCYAGPPSVFNPLAPANSSTDQPISVVLTTDISASYYWGTVCSPTVQTNTLTFYLAEGNVSPTVAVPGCSFTASPANSNNISVSCPLSGLKYNQQYSWRVLARNGNTGANGETYAPTTGYWTFTTRALPAWWQVIQGDIYGMSVQSTIPSTCTGTCKAYIELD